MTEETRRLRGTRVAGEESESGLPVPQEEGRRALAAAVEALRRSGHDGADEQGWGIRMYGSDTPVSTPFLALFPPFFRRFFALPGFLAPRRRERAKDGGKWAKNGRNRGAATPQIIRIPHPCR